MSIGALSSASFPVVATSPSANARRGATSSGSSPDVRTSDASTPGSTASPTTKLSVDEQRVLARLQQTDRKVRAHEMSHLGAGAGLVRGGPTYTYERGPDGQLYAVGGEVSIDTSPGNTPEETIRRAAQIRAAALAPADPSAQDRQVAAAATRMEMEARIEAAQQSRTGDAESSPGARGLEQRLQRALEPRLVGVIIDTYA